VKKTKWLRKMSGEKDGLKIQKMAEEQKLFGKKGQLMKGFK